MKDLESIVSLMRTMGFVFFIMIVLLPFFVMGCYFRLRRICELLENPPRIMHYVQPKPEHTEPEYENPLMIVEPVLRPTPPRKKPVSRLWKKIKKWL